MTAPHLWTLKQTQQALMQRQISSAELFDWFIGRIERFNPNLRAFIAVNRDIRKVAVSMDEKRSKGCPLGPLAGIPIAMKDLIDTSGVQTTYGGLHYAQYRPTTSATVVQRLEDAGAIIIGKSNLHEYAFGTTNENGHYGDARNPWQESRVSGGSSGGSSVAVTAGLATAAIGTDTGGSIRIPASLTGHVGLKPTFGLVSKVGVFPLAPSLDHVGPMTKTVTDAAILLNVMAGYDSLDVESIQTPVKNYEPTSPRRAGRIGIPRQFFFEMCAVGVLETVQRALKKLEEAGFEIVEVDIPEIHRVPSMQSIILSSEAFVVHRELFHSSPEPYGADVRHRLSAAKDLLAHDYISAQAFRLSFQKSMESVFNHVDVLLTPTTPITASPIGDSTTQIGGEEVPIRGHLTRYTNPWNFSGLPSISIPCGTTDNLPVGLQLVGSAFSEQTLLSIARAAEDCFEWIPVAPAYR